jgi:prepilin peptidase CpaA
MTLLGLLVLAVFPALLACAALYDLTTMTIPNWLTLALAAAFMPVALYAGFDLSLVCWHLLAGAGVLGVCFALFALGWIGGGDAKLAAAIAIWVGPSTPLLEWALLAAVFGGVLTLVLVAGRQLPLMPIIARYDWLARLHHPKTGVPYGIALAAGGLTVYPSLDIFARLAV